MAHRDASRGHCDARGPGLFERLLPPAALLLGALLLAGCGDEAADEGGVDAQAAEVVTDVGCVGDQCAPCPLCCSSDIDCAGLQPADLCVARLRDRSLNSTHSG